MKDNQLKIGGYAVAGIQLVLARPGYSKEYRASYSRYRVLVTLEDGKPARALEDIFDKTELRKLGYWSSRSNVLAMTCWGTSQLFEAQLALASFCNMKRTGEDWGMYCKRVMDLIRAI